MLDNAWAIIGGALGYGVLRMLKDKNGLIRPPGALEETAFLAACLRCGQCATACPYQVINIAGPASGFAVGTPYLTVRENPCRLCADFPCIKACPSGALKPVAERKAVRMGVARINRKTCLSWQGMRCEICYRNCPFLDEAIYLELEPNKKTGYHTVFQVWVNEDKCTGCGLCERSCPVEEAAIVVDPEGR